MSDFALFVEPLKCLRRDYANNDCSICINLCPEKAVTFKRGNISIDDSLCTLCHGCVGVCPTEAIESTKFEPNFFIAKEISLEKNELKQKLLTVITDNELWLRLSKNAVERSQQFSVQKFYDRLKQLLDYQGLNFTY